MIKAKKCTLREHVLFPFFLSVMNISGCSGDFIMFYDLVRLSEFEFSEYDDPISFHKLERHPS